MKQKKSTPTRRALRRLTDPAVIGWPLWWISLAVWLVSFYPQVPRGTNPITIDIVTAWFVGILVGQVIIFTLLLIAKKTWWHRGWAKRHPAIAVWTMIVSTFFGVLAANVIAAPFLYDTNVLAFGFEHVTYRSLALIVIGSGIIEVRHHRMTVAELQNAQTNLAALLQQSEEALITERQETLDAVDAVISDVMTSVEHSSAATVAILHQASENVLRPLSHDMATTRDELTLATTSTPTPRWRDVFETVTKTPLIAPRVTALIMLVLVARLSITDRPNEPTQETTTLGTVGDNTVGVSADFGSFGQFLVEMASVFFGTWLAAWIIYQLSAPLLAKSSSKMRWVIALASVLMVALLSQLFLAVSFAILDHESTLNYSTVIGLAFVIPIASITALVGLVRAVGLAQSDVREQLTQANTQLQWQRARTYQLVWEERQRLASVVHGPLRAALLSSALEISISGNPDDPESLITIESRVNQARSSLTNPPVDANWHTSIEQLQQLWHGTCEITLQATATVDTHLAADPVSAHVTTRIIEEACANAITHGSATRIDVHVQERDDTLEVNVTNNGTPPASDSQPGLGTKFLDDVSVEWDFTVTEDHVHLHALIPLTRD